MAKIFGFEIDSKRLFASVLTALTFGAAAAQDQGTAKIDDASNVIATGNIARPGQKLGPAIKIYADRSVKFADGRSVPEGIYPSVIGKVDQEALFNSGLGTDAIKKARNGLIGLSYLHLNKRGEAIHVGKDFTLAQFEAVAASAPEADPAFAAATLNAKPVVAKAKPPIRAEAPETEEVVFPVAPVVEAAAAKNFSAPAASAWEPVKLATYDLGAMSAPAAVVEKEAAAQAPTVLAPIAKDAWSEWRQTAKDRIYQIGTLVAGAFSLVGTLGLVAAFTSGRRQVKGGDLRTQDALLGTDSLKNAGISADNHDLPSYASVAEAFGLPEKEWEPVSVPEVQTSRGSEVPVLEGEWIKVDSLECPQLPAAAKAASQSSAPVFDPEQDLQFPAVLPTATTTASVAPLAAALNRAVNGDLATKLDNATVANQDLSRQTAISRDADGVIHVALSNNRLRLEIAQNEDGTYAVKAAGTGLGRGKAPVEATLGVDGRLVVDRQTLAARMSAKQTKGKDINAEFAKAAFEAFGAKAESVITSALTRAVAVLQAAPEPVAAIVRHGHRAAAIVRSARTASPKV